MVHARACGHACSTKLLVLLPFFLKEIKKKKTASTSMTQSAFSLCSALTRLLLTALSVVILVFPSFCLTRRSRQTCISPAARRRPSHSRWRCLPSRSTYSAPFLPASPRFPGSWVLLWSSSALGQCALTAG